MTESNSEIELLKEELNSTKTKLAKILDLVQKTFTGNSEAAFELSNIVNVPAPILCSSDENKSNSTTQAQNSFREDPAYQKTDNKTTGNLNSRLNFLNQVIDDHETMMGNDNRCVSQSGLRKGRIHSSQLRNRTKSADRQNQLKTKFDGNKYTNPYTWNLHENQDQSHLYKIDTVTSGFNDKSPSLNAKAILPKSTSTRREEDGQDKVRVEDFLFQSNSNKRNPPIKMSETSKQMRPSTDFRMNPRKPPMYSNSPKFDSQRPQTSSMLSYRHENGSVQPRRKGSASMNNRKKKQTMQRQSGTNELKRDPGFHNLPLQNFDESQEDDVNTEKLLREMEKRFELSTIDLQRRLGISHDGMVGLG